jgi:hypothetical protein
MNLFAMIVPGNLCDGGKIWCTAQKGDNLYISDTTMQFVDQDDDTMTVSFAVGPDTLKMKLNKHDDGWKYVGDNLLSDADACQLSPGNMTGKY